MMADQKLIAIHYVPFLVEQLSYLTQLGIFTKI